MFGPLGDRRVAVALAIIVMSICVACKSKSVEPFPASGAVAAWEKTSDTRTFAAKDLWQYIDGDAEQYIQAGVLSASTSDYKYRNQLEAVVDVYTMNDAAGARTVFDKGQTSEATKVQLGDEAVAYAQSVAFTKGPYLVRIVAYQDSPGAQQALVALARAVEAKL